MDWDLEYHLHCKSYGFIRWGQFKRLGLPEYLCLVRGRNAEAKILKKAREEAKQRGNSRRH